MNLEEYYNTDIGINSNYLYEITKKYKDTIFVDLGVRAGTSSKIMLLDSSENNNKIYGVDVDWSMLCNSVESHPNYTKFLGDSSTIGKYWNKKISGLFIDTFHIKEQVLTELYFWYPHIIEGGFIAFHDTNWPNDKNDTYGDIVWDRVEDAIKYFFNVNNLNYEDNFIKMSNYPESWGMTIVEIKNKKNYIIDINNWKEIIDKRNHLISLFWNLENKDTLKIDLILNV
jgi:hypothetical protein